MLPSLSKQKIVLIGPAGVGKTSLVVRLIRHEFRECQTTIGVDCNGYVIQLGDNRNQDKKQSLSTSSNLVKSTVVYPGYQNDDIGLQIWDVAGLTHSKMRSPSLLVKRQEHQEHMFYSMLETADGIMFCFDASDRSSLDQLDHWIRLAVRGVDDCCKLIVATKCDEVKQHVWLEKVQKTMENRGYDFIRTSAKSGMNVEMAFKFLARQIASTRTRFQSESPQALGLSSTCTSSTFKSYCCF